MADLNRVMLIGRLTRDAELKYTNTTVAICRIGLAVNTRKKQGDQWIEEPNFFDVVLWGRMGEVLHPYLVKGKQIAVEGELRQNRWEQDGQPRSKVEIVAENLQLLGGQGGQSNQGGQSAPRSFAPQQQNNQSRGGQSYDSYNDVPPPGNDFEEDIPF